MAGGFTTHTLETPFPPQYYYATLTLWQILKTKPWSEGAQTGRYTGHGREASGFPGTSPWSYLCLISKLMLLGKHLCLLSFVDKAKACQGHKGP